jgi:chromosome partitioning protein
VEDDGRVADPEPLRSRADEIFQSLRSARQDGDHQETPDVRILPDSGAETSESPSEEAEKRHAGDAEQLTGGENHQGEPLEERAQDESDPTGEAEPGGTETDGTSEEAWQAETGGTNGEAWSAAETAGSDLLVESPNGATAPPAEMPALPTFSPPVEKRAVHPGSLRPLPRTMAVANQKGGVGKTTTAVNLSAALAEIGYRVLVVDLDPQGNATTGLGINAHNLEHSVYDILLHDVPAEDVVEATSLRNLFVIPATIDLAGAEIELVPVFSRELRLRRALESVRDDFDFILIDCPPSLGLLTVNGLAAATEVTVPIQCEYYALEGLSQLIKNVDRVRSHLNQGLEVSTIIMTMYDARTKLADQVVNDVRLHFSTRVCRNVVPRTVRLSEAPSFGQPIIVFDPSSRGAIAYRELAKEVSGGASQRAR